MAMRIATIIITITRMNIESANLQRTPILLAWFSVAFPTGGFAYSNGLEALVAEGTITDETGFRRWLGDNLIRGSGWTDAVLFALAHRTMDCNGEESLLREIAALAAALAPSRERLAEALNQGTAFLRAVQEGWPQLFPTGFGAQIAYSVAAGACCGRLGVKVVDGLGAYLTAFVTNLIGVAIRLGLCGQAGGVRIMSATASVITEITQRAECATEAELGGCALSNDTASMRHEHLNGRLFLS